MDVEDRKQVLYLKMHNVRAFVSSGSNRETFTDHTAFLGRVVRGMARLRLRTRRTGE